MHRLWLLGSGTEQDELLDIVGSTALLVADGNHRVAAAARTGSLLSLVTAGPSLRITAFHRALVDTGLDAEQLRSAWLGVGLAVTDAAPDHPAPAEPGTVVVRCPTRTLVVTLPEPDADEPTPRIDHAVVERLLLAKALGLDPEGRHVRPVAGDTDGVDALLLLAPVPLADVLGVHADGRTMPRKSTYFTPKPRSGLLLADLT